MKILVLNYEYPPIGGGAAPVAKVTCEVLAGRGHEVTVVTMRYKGLPTYEKVNGVDIYRVPCLRKKAGVCHPWEQLTYIVSAKKFLKNHLKGNEHKYDICHTHFIIPSGVIAQWFKKRYGIPYVITAHGSDVQGYNKNRFVLLHKLLHPMWKKISRSAEVVISPSEYLKGLIEKSAPKLKCVVIPNGIDIKAYRTGPKENIILVMSRLQEHKGVQRVIQAFAHACYSDWSLHIAGDGPYREKLESLVSELGLGERVVFHGWLKSMSDEYVELLAKSRIFVLASEFENMPVSVLEAIASDCYVILSDIPAHKQFEKYGARLFLLSDINMLAEAITKGQHEVISPPGHLTNDITKVVDIGEISVDNVADRLEGVLSALCCTTARGESV